jgi:trk system potassium uptake protein TrkA
MRVLILGGTPAAYFVAREASARGDKVRFVDPDSASAASIAERLDLTVIVGAPDDPRLYAASADWAPDVVVALAIFDHQNLAACQLAQQQWPTVRTVALVNDPSHRDVFAALGVGTVVSATELLGAAIQHASAVEGVRARLELVPGRVVVIEVRLDEGSAAAEQIVRELALPDDVLLAAVVRDGEAIVPRGNLKLLVGDDVIVICKPELQQEAMETLLEGTR